MRENLKQDAYEDDDDLQRVWVCCGLLLIS